MGRVLRTVCGVQARRGPTRLGVREAGRLLDGLTFATRDYRDGDRPETVVDPFDGPAHETTSGLEAEARDIGRSLGTRPVMTLREP